MFIKEQKEKILNPYCHSMCQSVIAHLWENLSFPIDTIPNMKASSWNHLKYSSFLDTISTILCSVLFTPHVQKSYLPIQVKKIQTFSIQNGIRELSKATLWNEASMPSKNQKLHYILQEFLLSQ